MRDLVVIVVGILIVWLGIYAIFGIPNPFYVVASGSMVPELEIYDILIVQANAPFEELRVGDIIVFDRPSDHNRVIVHRVASIVDEDPRVLRTKGDANLASIPGTDYPITSNEYIGKVEIVIPDVGYITQALKPPVNYIIIAIIIGIMISKQFMGRKKQESKTVFMETAHDDENDNTDGDYVSETAKDKINTKEADGNESRIRDDENSSNIAKDETKEANDYDGNNGKRTPQSD